MPALLYVPSNVAKRSRRKYFCDWAQSRPEKIYSGNYGPIPIILYAVINHGPFKFAVELPISNRKPKSTFFPAPGSPTPLSLCPMSPCDQPYIFSFHAVFRGPTREVPTTSFPLCCLSTLMARGCFFVYWLGSKKNRKYAHGAVRFFFSSWAKLYAHICFRCLGLAPKKEPPMAAP